jgi:hypothetical protein
VRGAEGSVGIVSITDVERVLRALELAGELPSHSA